MDRLLLGRGEKASIVARPSRGDEASEEGMPSLQYMPRQVLPRMMKPP